MASIPAAPNLLRHPDLGPECTMANQVIPGPREVFQDSDGPGIALAFDPGLPMTLVYRGLRWLFEHRREDDAVYRIYLPEPHEMGDY